MSTALYASRLACYWQAGQGLSWPDLRTMMRQLIKERMGPVPFLPSYWLPEALAVIDRGDMIRPHMTRPGGVPRADLPDWLASNPAAMDAWDKLAALLSSAVNKFAQGKVAEGAREMAATQRDAALWDAMYRVTKAVADLPSNVVGGVLDGAGSVAGGLLKRLASSWLVWVAAIGVAGAVAWRAGLLRKGR